MSKKLPLPRPTNHPPKGSSIWVEPIKEVAAIIHIKERLHQHPRDNCLFVLGINSGYRASELLSITCGQVKHLKAGDRLNVYQSKVKKWRAITLNHCTAKALRQWLIFHPYPDDSAPLFISRNGNALLVPTISNMVKSWCAHAGLRGNYASHTLRKTWGYHHYRRNNSVPRHMALLFLMKVYGHTTEDQTREYICVQPSEVDDFFMALEL